MAKMYPIRVITKFELTRDDGAKQTFEPGLHLVDKATAEHWLVVQNSAVPTEEPPEPEPAPKAKG